MYHFRIRLPRRAVALATKVSWKWTLYQNLQNSTARKTILKHLGNLLSFWRNRRSNIRMLTLRSGLAHFSNWFNDDMEKWVNQSKVNFFISNFIRMDSVTIWHDFRVIVCCKIHTFALVIWSMKLNIQFKTEKWGLKTVNKLS